MQLLLPLLFWAQVATMPPSPIAPQRLETETAADADVLRSLSDNGDVPSILRPVDVRFVGSASKVRLLEKKIAALGWRVVQRVSLDDGAEALDVQRDQTTDRGAIRKLTEEALRIEA